MFIQQITKCKMAVQLWQSLWTTSHHQMLLKPDDLGFRVCTFISETID